MNRKNSPARHSLPRLVPGHRRRNAAPDRPDRRGVDARRGPRALRRKLRRRRVPPPHAGRHGLYGQPLRLPADHHARLAGHARDRGHALDARRDRLAVGGLHVERRRGADRRPQRPRSLPPDRPDAGRNPPPARSRQPYGHGGRRSRVGRGDGGPRRRGLLARPRTLRLGHLALLRPGGARSGSTAATTSGTTSPTSPPSGGRCSTATAMSIRATSGSDSPRSAENAGEGRQPEGGRPGTCGRLRTAALHPPRAIRRCWDWPSSSSPSTRLGADATPDLLCVCLDASRRISEAYGPESVEVEDMYYRLDRDLADFLTFVFAQVRDGNATVVLTSGPRNQPLLRRDDRRAGPVQRPAVRGDRERIPQRPLRHGRLGGDLRRQVHLAQP